MKKLIALASAAVAAAFFAPLSPAEAQIVFGPMTLAGVPVSLGCKAPDTGLHLLKTPTLVNETGFAIPRGRTLTWKASDGDHGSVKLEADLAAGASIEVKGTGYGGLSYTCSSTYLANPDLVVTSATTSSSGYVVRLQNLDRHAAAGASTVKLEFLSCATNAPLGGALAPVASIDAGGSVSVNVAASRPQEKSYLRVTADSGKQLVEADEANNAWVESMNACLR